MFNKWTKQKSPHKKEKDQNSFTIFDVKKGKVKKKDIVSKLSKKGTLEPLPSDVVNKRKDSGFRKSLTNDIDEISLPAASRSAMINPIRKEIPKVRDLLPFYSELINEPRIYKSSILLSLLSDHDESTLAQGGVFYNVDRIMVKVIDVSNSNVGQYVVNMNEFGIFYNEMKRKYENFKQEYFNPFNPQWWSLNIRKVVVIKGRCTKFNCTCSAVLVKVSKSAIELLVKEQIDKDAEPTEDNELIDSIPSPDISDELIKTSVLLIEGVAVTGNLIILHNNRLETYFEMESPEFFEQSYSVALGPNGGDWNDLNYQIKFDSSGKISLFVRIHVKDPFDPLKQVEYSTFLPLHISNFSIGRQLEVSADIELQNGSSGKIYLLTKLIAIENIEPVLLKGNLLIKKITVSEFKFDTSFTGTFFIKLKLKDSGSQTYEVLANAIVDSFEFSHPN